MRERYQRPEVKDLGTKWKLFYWNYSEGGPRRRRTKTWAKSNVSSQREAQRQANELMEKVNARNNEPRLFATRGDTVLAVYNQCRELTWPHLKNSTRKQYEDNFKRHLLPTFGDRQLSTLSRLELQAYFNSLSPDRSPQTIKLIHGTFRAALNQAIAWEMLSKNPAVGVKLPRKRAAKPPVLLPLVEIRRVLQVAPEPTRSLLVTIVFASMRPGEALALRWKDCLPDRIVVDERVYDDEFDDVKTERGEREVPLDRHGVILGVLQIMWDRNKKFRKPNDLMFANEMGKPLDLHTLLHRHLKKAAQTLGLPDGARLPEFSHHARKSHAPHGAAGGRTRQYGPRRRHGIHHAGCVFENVVGRTCRHGDPRRRSGVD